MVDKIIIGKRYIPDNPYDCWEFCRVKGAYVVFYTPEYYGIFDGGDNAITSCSNCFKASNVHLEPMTLKTLRLDDYVKDSDGGIRRILGTAGDIKFPSCTRDFNAVATYIAWQEMEKGGWTVYEPEQEKSELADKKDEELIKELEKRGKIKEGKIIKS